MTVEQFIADLDELVDAVRTRVGPDRVTIFGHSWASALGVLYAARFPEKVAAYVAVANLAIGRRASRRRMAMHSPRRSVSTTGRP